MGQLGEQPRFVLEHAQRVFVLGVVRKQALDHHIAKEAALAPLAGQKDLRHAAGRDLVEQLVAADASVLHAGQCTGSCKPAKGGTRGRR